MNYQRVSYFIKAAEILNFSKAARQLYIAPQSFGRQISLLEEELGGKLFERTTRGMTLTSFGQLCYERLSEPARAMESSFAEMCDVGHGRQNRIRVGVFAALSNSKVVMPLVDALQTKYPDKEIKIRMMGLGELKTCIQNGKIDIGITVTHDRETGWEKCTAYPLADCPAKIVVSKEHSWFMKDRISLEDMRNSSFVRMDIPQFSEADYWASIPCKQYIVVENYETLKLEIDRGRAFSIVASDIDEICGSGYKVFDLPGQPFVYTLVLIHNRDDKSGFFANVCQLLQKHFEGSNFK